MSKVLLRPGREKPVLRRHPWLFSGAIHTVEGQPRDGDIVEVYSSAGQWLARGYLNRHSQIAIRLLTWDAGEEVGRAFWKGRLERSISARTPLAELDSTTAYRIVHAESDGLPGLVVDRYGDWLVAQFLTQGMEKRKQTIVQLLTELTTPRGIYDRSDVPVRLNEGLEPDSGALAGESPPSVVEIREHGHRFLVDVACGQKTGFYLDQRENRRRVAAFARHGEVLNAFAYSGAFAVCALAEGACHVTNVDSSLAALQLAERNLALNGFDPDQQADQIAGDVFAVLRDYRDAGRQFDLVILDPPKFAQSKSQIAAAARGYKDINMLGMQLLRPNGILATFSCSGHISAELLQKILFGASIDAEREAQLLEWLAQPPDHPVLLSFPEGSYLKGCICRLA